MLSAQVRQQPSTNELECGMKKAELDMLIQDAERNGFLIRRIEIVGNTYSRYQEFNKRMAANFHEGYPFTIKALDASLRNISKLKTIYPIGSEDLEVRLDRQSKDVDIIFCVRQKPKKS
jgi:hypothetical protein